MGTYKVIVGDAGKIKLPDGSVDAIVTDPPYGLQFMGKRWDYDIPSVEVFAELHRVLRDGGRMLAFAGSRTFHRMWCNIEDAGFTIEDTVIWMYGQGFPKHKSKLKPAFEPIAVARKGGVTPLNVDACRIRTAEDTRRNARGGDNGICGTSTFRIRERRANEKPQPAGRWPANVVLSHHPECERVGVRKVRGSRIDKPCTSDRMTSGYGGGLAGHRGARGHGDPDGTETVEAWSCHPECPVRLLDAQSGGASRFFYCAKASRKEREAGLAEIEPKPGGSTVKGFTEDVARGVDRNRPVHNHHPTVKPISLMRWLCRLVTPPGGLILDPFCGSGSTGCAAVLEGYRFAGIDLNPEYVEIARKRIAYWSAQGVTA